VRTAFVVFLAADVTGAYQRRHAHVASLDAD
jgi:hypothetical protein